MSPLNRRRLAAFQPGPQVTHKRFNLATQSFRRTRQPRIQNSLFALGIRPGDVMKDTAPPQGIMDVASAVGSYDNDGPLDRDPGPGLWNTHLKIRQYFQQIGLKWWVGLINLVD